MADAVAPPAEPEVGRPHPADPRIRLWVAALCRPVPASDLCPDVPRAVQAATDAG